MTSHPFRSLPVGTQHSRFVTDSVVVQGLLRCLLKHHGCLPISIFRLLPNLDIGGSLIFSRRIFLHPSLILLLNITSLSLQLSLEQRQAIILDDIRMAMKNGLQMIDNSFRRLGDDSDPFIQYEPIVSYALIFFLFFRNHTCPRVNPAKVVHTCRHCWTRMVAIFIFP